MPELIDTHHEYFTARVSGRWRYMLFSPPAMQMTIVSAWHESNKAIQFNLGAHPIGAQLGMRFRDLPAAKGFQVLESGRDAFSSWIKDMMIQTGDFAIAADPDTRFLFQLWRRLSGGPLDGQSTWVFNNPMLIGEEGKDAVWVYLHDPENKRMVFVETLTVKEAELKYEATAHENLEGLDDGSL